MILNQYPCQKTRIAFILNIICIYIHLTESDKMILGTDFTILMWITFFLFKGIYGPGLVLEQHPKCSNDPQNYNYDPGNIVFYHALNL